MYQNPGYPKIVNFMGKLIIGCLGSGMFRHVQTSFYSMNIPEDDRTVLVFDCCAGLEWLDYQSPELTRVSKDHGPDLVQIC